MIHTRSGRNKKTLGFTLIELLVVISIISLLSSVVLAAVGEAKDKAKVAKFRQEMQQFITALELYKADNGVYPFIPFNSIFQIANPFHLKRSDNSLFVYKTNDPQLNSFNGIMNPDLSGTFFENMPLPDVITKETDTSISYYYIVNIYPDPSVQFFNSVILRCVGDTSVPEYAIVINNLDTLMYKAFPNWPKAETSDDLVTWYVQEDTRCFSLK